MKKKMDNKTTDTEAASQVPKASILRDVISFAVTLGIVLAFCNFVVAFHTIPTRSMEPTIRAKSFAVCWRLPYTLGDPMPEYGDIVSFKNAEKGVILIKRVVGLPGDTITFQDGNLVRNGEIVKEDYVAEQASTFPITAETYTVPDGCVFMMGDNRRHSSDSRALQNPYIPVSSLYAKYLFSFPIGPNS